MDGILVINKPLGMTSHDVVSKIRKIAKQKRVGHTGTLDPLATGVLPICLGLATRLAEYLSESGKAYRAEIRLGVITDTYDAEGEVLATAETSQITREQIEAVLPTFLGDQMQMPPRYSAIKIAGKPAYKLAREGQEVELPPRPVHIDELRIVDWQNPVLTLDVSCSKGTYIRSLAYDLGKVLECGGSLQGLLRTKSGPFTLAEAITLEQFAEAMEVGNGSMFLAPMDTAVPQFPALRADLIGREKLRHGNPLAPHMVEGEAPQLAGTIVRIYDETGLRLLALAQWQAEQQYWQPTKVFLENNG